MDKFNDADIYCILKISRWTSWTYKKKNYKRNFYYFYLIMKWINTYIKIITSPNV